MDRRRGAQGSPTVEDGDRARKRRKQSNESPAHSPKDDSRAALFDAVWSYQERSRNIRQHFEELPSEELYPDYYTKITNPISLKEIKAKLDRNEYAGIDDIKIDLLLMCENATKYNKPKSKVHSDALRLRKVVEGFDDSSNNGMTAADAPPVSGRNSKALRQAMVKLVDDMLALTNENKDLVSQYFKNLPSKKLYGDYYRLIKKPISLTQIRTRAKEGKYHGWSDFKEEVLLIRKNAEEYNAEGSDIVKDARELEAYFLKKLPEEKNKLAELPSSGIKLRLNMNSQQVQARTEPVSPPAVPKIKLNVGGKQPSVPTQASTPVPASAVAPPTPQPGANGISQSQPPPPPTPPVAQPAAATMPVQRQQSIPQQSPTPPVQFHHQPLPQTVANISRPVFAPASMMVAAATPQPRGRLDFIGANGTSHSPPPGSIAMRPRSETPHSQAMSPAVMPPTQRLSSTPRPPSFSPVPAGARIAPPPAPTSVPGPPVYAHAAYQQYQEPTIRAEGKNKSDALITNVRLTATSSTNLAAEPVTRDFEPHDRKVTVLYCMHLPSELDTVQIVCDLPPRLTRREYKFKAIHSISNAQPRELVASTQSSQTQAVYTLRLLPSVGVNTIEVTAVTKAQRPAGVNGVNGFAAAGVDSWEMERFRLFISPLH